MDRPTAIPRVALFADTYHELNGAARWARELESYARVRDYPFFCVRPQFKTDNASHPRDILELKRSNHSVRIDTQIYFDPRFLRFRPVVDQAIANFRPDIVHVMSPAGDMSILGVIAGVIAKVPIAMSWPTNFHEYLSHRIDIFASFIPGSLRKRFYGAIEAGILGITNRKMLSRANVILAPQGELVEMLTKLSKKPVTLMSRGVDCKAFSPEYRTRPLRDPKEIRIGYVGRLTPEKGLRLFETLDRDLPQKHNGAVIRFCFVGEGNERTFLEPRLGPRATFTGNLRGPDLSRAFANFDIFCFPSRTDTFGQVVQEAEASGVPPVVSDGGGPQYIIENGTTGFVAHSKKEFADHIRKLIEDQPLRIAMGQACRAAMLPRTWDNVLGKVYDTYRSTIEEYKKEH